MNHETGNGQLFLGSSQSLPKGGFLVAELDHEMETGAEYQNKDLHIIYASVDGSEADKLVALGIARHKNSQGKDVMFVFNEGQEVKI